MGKIYNTRQRDNIRDIIDGFSGEHFTAERILEVFRERGESVGVATVYRQLDKMVQDGELRKFASSSGASACYQAAEEHCEHFHLKCISCGRLIHLSCEHLAEVEEHIRAEHGFNVDIYKTVLLGVCNECAAVNEAPSKENIN